VTWRSVARRDVTSRAVVLPNWLPKVKFYRIILNTLHTNFLFCGKNIVYSFKCWKKNNFYYSSVSVSLFYVFLHCRVFFHLFVLHAHSSGILKKKNWTHATAVKNNKQCFSLWSQLTWCEVLGCGLLKRSRFY